MNAYLKKSVAVGLTALALGLGAAAATTTPADAQGVWHHGYWGGGYYHNGWWGPAVGLGILGGVVAGAAIASSGPYYGPGPYYGAYGGPGYAGGCGAWRSVYDNWGHYVGRQWVNVC
jgi:hypothetical protein